MIPGQSRTISVPIFERFDGIVNEVNDVHSANASSPIVVTEFGKLIEVNDEQARNAVLPTEVRLLPLSVTVFKAVQYAKAPSPIEVTVDGIVIDVKAEQPLKVAFEIFVIPEESDTVLRFIQS